MKKSLIPLLIINLLPLSFSCRKYCMNAPCYDVDKVDPYTYRKNDYLIYQSLFKFSSFEDISLEYKYNEYCDCKVLKRVTNAKLTLEFETTNIVYSLDKKELIDDEIINEVNASIDHYDIILFPYDKLNYSLVDVTKKEKQQILEEVKNHENILKDFFNDLDTVYSLNFNVFENIIKPSSINKGNNNVEIHGNTGGVNYIIPFKDNKCVLNKLYSYLDDALCYHGYNFVFKQFYEDFGNDFTEEEFLTKLGLN